MTTPAQTALSIPFSAKELNELRRLGFRLSEDGLVHRPCGEVVTSDHEQAITHHQSCVYTAFWEMGYLRNGTGFVHSPWGCHTTDPRAHRRECTANYRP